MLHRARDAASAEQLGFIIVNESQQLLPYRQAAVWREGLHRHVAALSGLAELDPTAPYMQWLSRVFRHLAEPGAPDAEQTSRLIVADDLPAALAEEWTSWPLAHALWLRLGEQGACLLARELPWSDYERKLAEELAHGYGHALLRFAPRRDWRELARQWLRPGRKQRRLLIAALLLACMPIRLSVLARGEVAPQDPVLLRAPLSGVIDRIQVQPNQRVKAGDALFDLDATSLAGQFAMAARERDAAQKASAPAPSWRSPTTRAAGDGAGPRQAGRKASPPNTPAWNCNGCTSPRPMPAWWCSPTATTGRARR